VLVGEDVVEVLRCDVRGAVAAGEQHGPQARIVRMRLDLGAVGARARLEDDPGTGIAARVDVVVEEPRVPPQRDAATCGVEVGLGGDGVLLVAQPVGRVGEQLDERDVGIGRVPLAPLRRERRHAIEHQSPEAGVILRQVVELRLVERLRRAAELRLAVERVRAARLEREVDRRELRIEVVGHGVVGGRRPEPQRVGRVVAACLDCHGQPVARGRDRSDLDAADARAAVDRDLVDGQRRHRRDRLGAAAARQVMEEGDLECQLVRAHLEVVDAVERRRVGVTDRGSAARGPAAIGRRHPHSPRERSTVRRSPVCRTV
jgi:hypothetical protein